MGASGRPPAYQKLGYEVFGEADDWPVGHTHYFLREAAGVQVVT